MSESSSSQPSANRKPQRHPLKLPLLPVVLLLCAMFGPILLGILFIISTFVFGGKQVPTDYLNPLSEGPGIIQYAFPIVAMLGIAFLVGALYKIFITHRYREYFKQQKQNDDSHTTN